jgi:hypothetical protein
MKTVKTIDGKITFTCFTFEDLSEEAKAKAINDHIEFEIEVMNEDSQYYYLAEEMNKMQTPWFLGEAIYEKHKDDIIESIVINEYLFDVTGEILPFTTHVKDNKPIKQTWTFNNQELEVTIV